MPLSCQSVATLITSQFLKVTPSSGRVTSTIRVWGLSALDNHKIVLPDWYNENRALMLFRLFLMMSIFYSAVWPTVRKGITSGSYILYPFGHPRILQAIHQQI